MDKLDYITVAAVEDDAIIRRGLVQMIDEAPDLVCVGAFPTAESASVAIPSLRPDVVLMDIELPDGTGTEVILSLCRQMEDPTIVVLTVHDDDATIFDALCAGACGFLAKSESPDRIRDAVREAHEGGAPMSTGVARLVVASFKRMPAADSKLTPRETSVLSALCEGKSYQAVADGMAISVDTVRAHIRSIYRKLEVHSKSEAVAVALRQGIV